MEPAEQNELQRSHRRLARLEAFRSPADRCRLELTLLSRFGATSDRRFNRPIPQAVTLQ
jgi:hypothetical protein